jgi:hypothetical protein
VDCLKRHIHTADKECPQKTGYEEEVEQHVSLSPKKGKKMRGPQKLLEIT